MEAAEVALEGSVPASSPSSGVLAEHAATGGEHYCPALEPLPAYCSSLMQPDACETPGAFIDGVFNHQP